MHNVCRTVTLSRCGRIKSTLELTSHGFDQQGINWLIRKMMAAGAPTLVIKEMIDVEGKAQLDIELSGPAGIKGQDQRVLDWQPLKKSNGPFGLVESK